MLTQGDWPGAITELEGAGRFFNQLSSQAVKDAALNRIREVICSTVTQQQRDALIEWLHFLQNPEFPKNPTPDEQKAISLFNSSFPPLKNFLREVIANVEKPCPK